MAAAIVLPYRIRYASGRDTCIKCGTAISKGQIQLAIVEQSLTDDCMEPKWYDRDCFFKHRRPASETLIDGFANLRVAHQMEIRKILGFGQSHTPDPMDIDQPPEKKNCSVHAETVATSKNEIDKENKEFFEIRGKLKVNTNREDRIAILNFNKQFVPEGNSEILNHLTDVLYFGAMKPCAMCGDGQFVFKNAIYTCSGNISEWSKCVNTAKIPHRVPAQLPEKYRMSLRGNFKVRTRILNDVPQIDDDDYALCVTQPLFGMELMIAGETTKPKHEIELKIKQMGGTLIEKIHENVAAIISNPEQVAKMGVLMEDAKKHGIPIVPDTFIDDIKNIDPIELIVMCDLSNWGQNPHKRLSQFKTDDTRSLGIPSTSTGAIPKVQGMKWKYGSVVDPDSKLEDIAHVYDEGTLKYYAILDLVDIAANKNSYFKMQLLESDKEQKYWLFESKGRIATSIGSIKLTPMSSLSEATATFKNLYLEKTGNAFGTKKFVKKPGKYNEMPVDREISHKGGLKQYKTAEYSLSTSVLSEPIYKLIQWLFDVVELESTMISFDLDLNKMPLGKISGEQIQNAMEVLRKIEKLLWNRNGSSTKQIVDASNEFYSLIPHNFGIRRPPLLNTKETINKKFEMLSDMKQMDITYKILDENIDDGRNAVDIHYRRLMRTVEITNLDKESDEYTEINRYVTNTTFNDGFNIELLHVFKISRHVEIERFAPFEGTSNRKLLFHGTRLTNIVGIMTNGLKLPEYGGGMLGKGIYFADAVSKSVNYCRDSNENALMLLCEVALGDCKTSTVDRLFRRNDHSADADSVQGLGIHCPATFLVRPDGLIVPNGVLVESNIQNAHLRFNEYSVYNESRVKIRYLLKLKVDPRPIPNLRNLPNISNLSNRLNPPNNPLRG